MRIDMLLGFGIALILALSPLPFGSVEPLPSALLVLACMASGVAWVAWRAKRRLPPLPWRDPAFVGGVLFLLLCGVQLVPLPRGWLERVSPEAVRLREAYGPPPPAAEVEGEPAPGEGPARFTLSMYPWATRKGMLRFASFLLAGLMAMDLAGRAFPRLVLAVSLSLSGIFQSVYGLGEYFTGNQQIFGYPKRHYADVVTGTFINRNHFAGYLEMTLPVTLALAAMVLSRRRGSATGGHPDPVPRFRERNLFLACLLLVGALTMVTALLCSGSRMGFASVLFAFACVGISRFRSRVGRRFLLAALSVGGAMAIVFAMGGDAPVLRRFPSAGPDLFGDLGRWTIWKQAGGMVRAFPVAGAGLGTFPHLFPVFRTTGAGVSLAHAHNDFLEFTAEMGVAGWIVGLLAVSLVVRSFVPRARRSVDLDLLGTAALAGGIAMAVHSFTDFNLAIPANAITLAVLAGWFIRWRRPPESPHDGEPPARARAGAAAVPAVALLGTGVLALSVGTGNFRPGQEGGAGFPLNRGNAEYQFDRASQLAGAALGDFEALWQSRARGVNPSPSAFAYVEDRLREAIRWQTSGLRHLPTSSRGHFLLGYLRFTRCAAESLRRGEELGCGEGEVRDVLRAVELDPMNARLHTAAGRFLLAVWPSLNEAQRDRAQGILEAGGRPSEVSAP